MANYASDFYILPEYSGEVDAPDIYDINYTDQAGPKQFTEISQRKNLKESL